MNMHAPTPSLIEHLCGQCGARDSDPTWHRQPAAGVVSPLRDATKAMSPSWEAARSVRRIRASQQLVLSVFRRGGPMTDEQSWALYGTWTEGCVKAHSHLSISGFRTRRSELVKAGLLRDTGERKVGSTGRKMIVWEAA